ncbi:hypothetical protein GQ54DRAFT_94692 [Martensiomyces pterosporus]|nr:hypothetical protein GQ54DRAFT_94692 [Martensiomyces pterosporus]
MPSFRMCIIEENRVCRQAESKQKERRKNEGTSCCVQARGEGRNRWLAKSKHWLCLFGASWTGAAVQATAALSDKRAAPPSKPRALASSALLPASGRSSWGVKVEPELALWCAMAFASLGAAQQQCCQYCGCQE